MTAWQVNHHVTFLCLYIPVSEAITCLPQKTKMTSPPLVNGFEKLNSEFRNLSSSYFPPLAPDGQMTSYAYAYAQSSPVVPPKPLFLSQAGYQGRKSSLDGPHSPLSEVLSASSLSLISHPSSDSRHTELSSSSDAPTRSASSKSYNLPPMKPTPINASPVKGVSALSDSRSPTHFNIICIPSEDIRALGDNAPSPLPGSRHRASMVLYRFIGADEPMNEIKAPFCVSNAIRDSFASSSGDSVITMSQDSKYPMISHLERGLVAYAFDPLDDLQNEEDDSTFAEPEDTKTTLRSRRRIGSVVSLVVLLTGMLALLIVYPVVSFHRLNHRNRLIAENPYINSSGQAEPTIVVHRHERRSQMPLR